MFETNRQIKNADFFIKGEKKMKKEFKLQYYDNKLIQWIDIHKANTLSYLINWYEIYRKECPRIKYRIICEQVIIRSDIHDKYTRNI